jgi:hypothetical protein
MIQTLRQTRTGTTLLEPVVPQECTNLQMLIITSKSREEYFTPDSFTIFKCAPRFSVAHSFVCSLSNDVAVACTVERQDEK